jgi:hypothetical protein
MMLFPTVVESSSKEGKVYCLQLMHVAWAEAGPPNSVNLFVLIVSKIIGRGIACSLLAWWYFSPTFFVDFETVSILAYEEVIRLTPSSHTPRPVVLVGRSSLFPSSNF